nr:hypothetical protein [Tanacetum cinerariifolium]
MLVTIAQLKFLLPKLCQVFHSNTLVVKILRNLPVCYDDDDDEERSDSLYDNIISGLPPFSAITPDEPVLSTEELDNSLSMWDEHLDTIPATKSDEFIKSGVENLIPIPSESEGIPDHMCDVPFLDNSPPLDVSKNQFEDFSESNKEFSSTDDDSFSLDNIDYVEASPPDPIPFYDPVISGTPLNLTPSGESDFFLEVDAFLAVEDEFTSSQFHKSYLDPEGDMLLFEAFLNDDHSSDFKSKSSSTSLNSLLEETHTFDNSLPEFTTFSKVLFDATYESDSSDDQNNTLSFAEKESFHFDIPLFSRPPAKPPDGDTGILNIKMMGDVSDQKAFMHKLMITLAPHQEKSPDLISHRCGTVKKFNTHRSHLNECPMMIHGQNNPILDALLFHFYPP